MKSLMECSTGIPSLDRVINNLRIGDNVVWQVDEITDYFQFAKPYVQNALSEGRRVVYMRFAQHEPILQPGQYDELYTLDSYSGFESFSTEVHSIIKREGEEVYYVFDCLSDLQSAWATDLMIGNFFMVTCPYLFELNTIAYFAILRNSLSFKTIARIRETTQVLIDVYNSEGSYYIHPLKVWNRYAPTMFFPHLKKNDRLTPVTNSVDAARLIQHVQQKGAGGTRRNLDYWDRLFLKAEDLHWNPLDGDERDQMLDHLCRVMIGRDERILSLATRHLALDDFLNLKDRLIGTGYIGGKAVGMLLARKILTGAEDPRWSRLLEPHDSFYIGSDVFYTYIVQNGWWKPFMEHKTEEGYFKAASELHEKMLTGSFPDEVKEKFQYIIEYFGQSPFIVRSSSLLEDAFGNAFAGKYDSFFCVNQGTPARRLAAFAEAVRRVFASTMDEDALTYRLQRGLDRMDEQMALLVQRVSGSHHGKYFFPDMGGVGMSYNTFVWKSDMDPKAGMLRLVLGLGTRAVNRVEGDYPLIVALDSPLTRPHAGMDDARKFSQHDVDVLDIPANEIRTVPLTALIEEGVDIPIDAMAVRDLESEQRLRDMGHPDRKSWVLTFERLLSDTAFAADMQRLMKTIEGAYSYPVDIEFTINFDREGAYHVNLLQCRPQQTRWQEKRVEIPAEIDPARTLFRSEGYFMGGNIAQRIKRIIVVDPRSYGTLPLSQKYDIARLVGRLNRQIGSRAELPTLLMGPGRWGTSTPSLGVPVRFSEINNIAVLMEIASMRDDLVPELSFGTHFFQDLVETDIFYVALFPDNRGTVFNDAYIAGMPNMLGKLLPDEERYAGIVRVYDIEKELVVVSDIISQKIVCFEDGGR
ncbi:MAG: PEP/pyruvate-binding domain-containing protein [Spirochaetota bacterium]